MSDMKTSSPPRRFFDRSLVQLTLVRFREFTRQPEAVFWTFVFPILLAVGLGLAFRSRAPERPKIGVVSTDPSAGKIVTSLEHDSSLTTVVFMTDTAAQHALRTAKIALLVAPSADGGVKYVFDSQRSEASSARLIA